MTTSSPEHSRQEQPREQGPPSSERREFQEMLDPRIETIKTAQFFLEAAMGKPLNQQDTKKLVENVNSFADKHADKFEAVSRIFGGIGKFMKELGRTTGSGTLKTFAEWIGRDSGMGKALLAIANTPAARMRYIADTTKILLREKEDIAILNQITAHTAKVKEAWKTKNPQTSNAYDFEKHVDAVALHLPQGAVPEKLIEASASVLEEELRKAQAAPLPGVPAEGARAKNS